MERPRFVTALVLVALIPAAVLSAAEPARRAIPNWAAPLFYSPPAKTEPAAPEEGLVSEGALPSSPLPFVAITPCRVVDTRPTSGFPAGYGAPALVANATRNFDLDSAAHCSAVPVGAAAYSLNVTVTETQGFGDVRIWPAGDFALVSTQNWPAAGVTLANAAIVPAGTDGAITVQAAGSGTHLIIDVNGYYGGNFDSLYVNEGQASSVTSAMITDGTIVNADINAAAAIADTKLATIETAGKVADSALSANVSKLGATIEASEITDIERSVLIPMTSFTDCGSAAGAFLDFTSGADAIPDFDKGATEGLPLRLVFDSTGGSPDQNYEVCSQFLVPPDYVSGGEFRVRGRLADTPDPATEVLNCTAARNNGMPGAAGTATIAINSFAFHTCNPAIAGLVAGDYVDFEFFITSATTMDDDVWILAVEFRYVASQ